MQDLDRAGRAIALFRPKNMQVAETRCEQCRKEAQEEESAAPREVSHGVRDPVALSSGQQHSTRSASVR